MSMRIVRHVLLSLLVISILAIGTLSAKTENQNRSGDQWLAREVGHELITVPWYSVFDILKYRVEGGEVTLLGAVVNPTVKTDAINAVKRIEGVKKVTDQIEVLPTSPMDDQIRRATFHALFSQPQLQRYEVGNLQAIHIIVKNGHVSLEGNVDSQQDKDAATIYAKGVSNVFSVDNNLTVGSGAK
jgi:hyperosmotically inducible protein